MKLVPLAYTLRSIWQRPSSTVLTVLGIAATAGVLAGLLCLQQGFRSLFVERGREDLVILLRPGANAEGESGIARAQVDIIKKSTAEFAADEENQRPLASAELFLAMRRFKRGGGETNVAMRGVQPETFAIHGSDLEIVDGRKFEPGADEVIVGERLVDRIQDCKVGEVLQINTTPFRVVGVLRGKGAQNSEIWGDADRLMAALERPVFSRMIAQLKPGTDLAALNERFAASQQFSVVAMTERAYLTKQTGALSGTFAVMGLLLAVVMGVGALFTGINAMLAAIASRTYEIGVLKAIGYRPFAIFVAFLLEAVVLAFLGGVLGCLLVLPLQGMETGTTNFDTFSEIAFAFRIDGTVILSSILFAVVLGLVGGAFPAWRAARMTPTEALRRG